MKIESKSEILIMSGSALCAVIAVTHKHTE